MKNPMVEVSATVPRPPDAVLAEVIDVVRSHGGGRIEIDHDNRTIAVQGSWWYRGEYEIEATGKGSRLTHRVRNVASRGRWAVPLANRMFVGYRARTRANFATFVAGLSR